MKDIERFGKFLKENGYKKNSIVTYIKAVERFSRFLMFYGYKESDFNQEELVSYFSSFYKKRNSLLTALSAVAKFLEFKFNKRFVFSVDVPENEETEEFKFIKEETFDVFLKKLERSRKEEVKIALYLMIFLGLKPSQIERMGSFSLGSIEGIPAIEKGKIKRLLLDEPLISILQDFKGGSGFIELDVKRGSLKVLFSKLVGKEYSINDFRENYAYRLISRGLPVDIVVEYSEVPLDRVSYLYRVFTLKTKQEIIRERFTQL